MLYFENFYYNKALMYKSTRFYNLYFFNNPPISILSNNLLI